VKERSCFAAAPAQAAPSLVEDDQRTGQFVIERACKELVDKGLSPEADKAVGVQPFPVWVFLRPHKNHDFGCSSPTLLQITATSVREWNQATGIHADPNRTFVCDHMGRLIE